MARGRNKQYKDPIVEEKTEVEVVEEIKDEIPNDNTEELPAKEVTNGPETKNGIVMNCIHVKARRSPSCESGNVVGLLRSGEKVVIHEKIDNFYKVSTSTYSEIYISSDFIKEV